MITNAEEIIADLTDGLRQMPASYPVTEMKDSDVPEHVIENAAEFLKRCFERGGGDEYPSICPCKTSASVV